MIDFEYILLNANQYTDEALQEIGKQAPERLKNNLAKVADNTYEEYHQLTRHPSLKGW